MARVVFCVCYFLLETHADHQEEECFTPCLSQGGRENGTPHRRWRTILRVSRARPGLAKEAARSAMEAFHPRLRQMVQRSICPRLGSQIRYQGDCGPRLSGEDPSPCCGRGGGA